MTNSNSGPANINNIAAAQYDERLTYLLRDPKRLNELRRTQIGTDLAIALSKSSTPHDIIAERAGMHLATLYDHLDGEVNFSLDSIDRICGAIGYDFDVVLRPAGEPRALQPWQYPASLPQTLATDWNWLLVLLPTSVLPITTVGWWITHLVY